MPPPGSSARGQAQVGIHDFADAGNKIVDGGPAPAMTGGRRLSVKRLAAWYDMKTRTIPMTAQRFFNLIRAICGFLLLHEIRVTTLLC